MSEDYETKRSETHEPARDSAGERPAVEDPLVELARIVHNNKQSGANVNSGRVGTTDYFAGLDDVALDPAAPVEEPTSRVEPTFGIAQPAADNQNDGPGQPADAPTVADTAVHEDDLQTQVFEHAAPSEPSSFGQREATPLRPEVAELQATVHSAVQAVNRLAETPSEPSVQPPLGAQPVETLSTQRAAEAPTHLTPSVALDLEQNLTAELEDELIGALRQSVDDGPASSDPFSEIPEVAPQVQVQASESVAPTPAPQVFPASSATPVDAGHEALKGLSALAGTPYPAENSVDPVVQPVVPIVAADTGGYRPEPDNSVASQTPPRPAIDENDLLAALEPARADAPGIDTQAPLEDNGDAAGIDALFADLDFPDPAERNNAAPQANTAEPEAQASAAEIDDMTWPAAAASVPSVAEDETPPPPEGYDLDAVARAMQESDPSLSGAGVLPPHSDSEQNAATQSKGKSRRGLFVVAGILGIAAVGATGFYFIDGDAVQVPSGPPPVISGLQDPLKVFPDGKPVETNDQPGKLIYDRVDGTGESGPDRLVSPESPQPAELPPAPEGTSSTAELVPGAPKRVSTYIVRPDGTIVSEGQNTTAPVSTPQAPAPATPTSAPAGTDAPRIVATTPVTTDGGVTAPAPAAPVPATPTLVGTPETAPVEPTPNAVSPVPANPVAGTEQPLQTPDGNNTETAAVNTDGIATTEPAAPVPTVLPRKKPAAPIRVATAPTTQPAPAQSNGPLNLSQPTPAPATTPQAPVATSSGDIPAGTYIVQVTSQRSASAASGAYAGLQRRFPAILGNRDAVIVSADLGDRGVFYRARIPTGSRDEAISLCESLKGAGGDCFVRRSP